MGGGGGGGGRDGGAFNGVLQRSPNPTTQNPPAAKFASQSDAHVRTNAKIKFLYYPLSRNILPRFAFSSRNLKLTIFSLEISRLINFF